MEKDENDYPILNDLEGASSESLIHITFPQRKVSLKSISGRYRPGPKANSDEILIRGNVRNKLSSFVQTNPSEVVKNKNQRNDKVVLYDRASSPIRVAAAPEKSSSNSGRNRGHIELNRKTSNVSSNGKLILRRSSSLIPNKNSSNNKTQQNNNKQLNSSNNNNKNKLLRTSLGAYFPQTIEIEESKKSLNYNNYNYNYNNKKNTQNTSNNNNKNSSNKSKQNYKKNYLNSNKKDIVGNSKVFYENETKENAYRQYPTLNQEFLKKHFEKRGVKISITSSKKDLGKRPPWNNESSFTSINYQHQQQAKKGGTQSKKSTNSLGFKLGQDKSKSSSSSKIKNTTAGQSKANILKPQTSSKANIKKSTYGVQVTEEEVKKHWDYLQSVIQKQKESVIQQQKEIAIQKQIEKKEPWDKKNFADPRESRSTNTIDKSYLQDYFTLDDIQQTQQTESLNSNKINTSRSKFESIPTAEDQSESDSISAKSAFIKIKNINSQSHMPFNSKFNKETTYNFDNYPT